MSFDLTSESGEEFEFSNSGWRYLMEFAKAHGFCWPVENGEEKESLTAAQAAALADAIERGMGEGSLSEIATRISNELTKLLVTPTNSPMFRTDPIQFKPETIEYWKQFLRFARLGGFSMIF